MSRFTPILQIVVVLGVAARLLAASLNDSPHGDVHLDVATLDAFASGGGLTTPLERAISLYPYPGDPSAGYPLDQHPPLAILLAAAVRPLTGDSYRALQAVSLLAGLLLILLGYALARRWYDADAGWLAAALIAGSFLLADFAGNGSIYTLQALLALAAVYALSWPTWIGPAVAGAVLGLAYLTNYQSLVYWIAVLAAGIAVLRDPNARRGRVAALAGIAVGFAAVAAPWWMRNQAVFGDPTFSVNPIYAKAWFGATMSLVERDGDNLLVLGSTSWIDGLRHLKGILVVNVRSFGLQTPWWVASLIGAGVIGGLATLRGLRRAGAIAPLALSLMAATHVATTLLWPAMKFRYLVPLVPMAALLAVRATRAPSPRWMARAALGVTLVLVLVATERLLRDAARDGVLALTAVVIAVLPAVWSARGGAPVKPLAIAAPFLIAQAVLFTVAHPKTTYYDGILVADAFGRRGQEAADREAQALYREVAATLLEMDAPAVVANIELKHHLTRAGSRTRVIQPLLEGLRDPPALSRALTRHRVDHALAMGAEELAFYRDYPGFSREIAVWDGPGRVPWALVEVHPL